MRDILTKNMKLYLHHLAESAVSIPKEYVARKGGEYGRWDRETRVAVVYSALCSMVRNNAKTKCKK